MDIYNSKLAIYLARKRGVSSWAITIFWFTFYSCGKDQVDIDWRQHEDTHKMQGKREGYILMIIHYLQFSQKVGYQMNPYEIEARRVSA